MNMPDFDAPRADFVKRLLTAGFTEDQIMDATGALGDFTGAAFGLMQQDIHGMIDEFGMTASLQFADEVGAGDEWHKGFLAGVVASTQVALYGREHTEKIFTSGIIPQLRRGMDALLASGDELPAPVAKLVRMVGDGVPVPEDVVREAAQAWAEL